MKRLVFLGCLAVSGCEVDPYCLTCDDVEAGTDAGFDSGVGDGGDPADGGVDSGNIPDARIDGCLEMELCNELDDNCNGEIDEGFDLDTNPEHCGGCNELCAPPHAFGVCVAGECTTGMCDVGFYDLTDEPGCEYRCSGTPGIGDSICDLRDDDCDGMVDEDVDLDGDPVNCGRCGRVCRAPHATATCESGVCAMGDCDPDFYDINGRLDDGCEYACMMATPSTEVCNLRDDDCDGTADEGNPGGGVPCGDDEGECAMGTTRCDDGRLVCDGEVRPVQELCNNRDDDCDMSIDENNPQGGRVCGTSVGICEIGAEVCMGGALVCMGATDPGTESCNNLDDDCDGTTDDGNPGGGALCGSDVGECRQGMITCSGGALSCMGAQGPVDELCNGLDDNCDGATDEDNPGGGGLCGSDVGICTPGTRVCMGGSLVCTGAFTGRSELCNGQDDDCDGAVDDGNPEGGAACGISTGECNPGAMTCQGGVLVCSGATGPRSETCNTLDDDCDGMSDEDFSLMTDVNNCGMCGRVCSFPNAIERCTSGMCQIAACESGFHDLDPMAPGCEYACNFRGQEACNGVDDDCDNRIDESLTVPTGFCNPNGVCAGTNASCGGAAGWRCVYPATFQAIETRCDALDNDCDGLADEPFPLKGTACSNGIGSCRRNGMFVCNAAQDGLTCNAAAAGSPADEACDGLDNDCDDAIDERVVDNPGTAWRDGVDLNAIATVPVDIGGGVIVRVMQYEASHADASATSAGDDAVACSRPNVQPWTSVTWDQAQAACCALNPSGSCGATGWRLCDAPHWETACEGVTGTCEWSYASSCSTSQPTVCNGAEFDCNTSLAGDQDCLFPTGAPQFPMCSADWGASDIFDMSGNVREWTATSRGTNVFEVRGGSYNHIELGRACDFNFSVAQRSDSLPNTGFRCCFY